MVSAQRDSQDPRTVERVGIEEGRRSRRGATEETIRVWVLGESFAVIRPAVMAAVARDSRLELVSEVPLAEVVVVERESER